MDIEKLCLGCMTDKGDERICPHCGYDPDLEPASPIYLPPGTILNKTYLLGRVLGHGGFGITYLAWDMSLELKVAVKEYLPDGLATRSPDSATVTCYTGDKARHFEYGLQKFLDEARTLARFHDHPGIVSVMYVFEEHETAYFVMSYLEGATLKGYIRKQGGRIRYSLARDIIMPVLDALRVVHERGLLHRDISPDNIFITTTGQVKLLDFGAARYSMGEQSRSLSVILKPGYAPEEQYRSKGHQGPWTDIYATAATMYRAITGVRPEEALDRMEEDELKLPSELGAAIPPEHEQALMKALSVKAGDRFQNVDEFQAELLGTGQAEDVPGAEPVTGMSPFPPDGFNKDATQAIAETGPGAAAGVPQDDDATRELAPNAYLAADATQDSGMDQAPDAPADMPTPPTQQVIPPPPGSVTGTPTKGPRSAAVAERQGREGKGFPWGKFLAISLVLLLLGGGAWVYFVHPEWLSLEDEPGRKRPGSSDLTPVEMYTLTVDTIPLDAQVALPGSGFSYAPGMSLEPGTYTVAVSSPDYITREESVTITDENVRLSVELIPKPASVDVTPDNGSSENVFIEPSTGMEFVQVPGGCYEMGCGPWANDCDDDEYPAHMVCVDDFWMGRYEVTQAEYEYIMGANPSSSGIGPDYPVDNVSHVDASLFAQELSNNSPYTYRLPTEAEWEYACRDMGQHQVYSGGYDASEVAQSRDQGISSSQPVGRLASNSLGIYDMSGNVWEWVLDMDVRDPYSQHVRNNPVILSGGENYIIRGGSWVDVGTETRCGERGSWLPTNADYDLGFRLVRTN